MYLNVVCLRVQIIELKGLQHEFSREVMPKVVNAHAHVFTGELLRTLEGESPPSCNEVRDAFVLPLLSFNIFWDANLSLGITEALEELLLYCLPTHSGSLKEV